MCSIAGAPYKKQELLTFREHVFTTGFGCGFCWLLVFIFCVALCFCVLFVFVLCLVYPVSLDYPFFIAPFGLL